MAVPVKDAYIQIKVDPELKSSAAAVADEIGMNLTTLINVYLKRVVADRAIPFTLTALAEPNLCTQQAIRDLRAGKAQHFDTAEEALQSLGI